MFIPLSTFDNLHKILRDLYLDMMPLCDKLTGIASGIAGIGALIYISYRVWQAIARAEAIDVFPLLRPFAIGLAIMFFQPVVVGSLNSILSPITIGCHELMKDQSFDVKRFREKRAQLEEENMKRAEYETYMFEDAELDKELADKIQWEQSDLTTMEKMYAARRALSLEGIINTVLKWILEFVFQVASLILDTIRTFYLVVLTILGPIAFAISVYDGFQASMVQWFSKYISVYLWLPIADLFGAILNRLQALSTERSLADIMTNPFHMFDSGDNLYLAFLAIGIIGYFVIPSIATWVVQAGGFSSYNRKLAAAGSTIVNYGSSMAGGTAGYAAGAMAAGKGTGGQAGGGASGASASTGK